MASQIISSTAYLGGTSAQVMAWRRKMSRDGSGDGVAAHDVRDGSGDDGSGDAVATKDVGDVPEVVIVVGVLALARLGRCRRLGRAPGRPRGGHRPGRAGGQLAADGRLLGQRPGRIRSGPGGPLVPAALHPAAP